MFPADWADKKGTTAVPQNSKRRKLNQKEELKTLLDRCSQVMPGAGESGAADYLLPSCETRGEDHL